MSSKSNSSGGGLGCGGVIQVIFIVLKLLNLIDWSWWWVMSPTLIDIAFAVILLIIFLLAAAMKGK
jgi:hypothetical protein